MKQKLRQAALTMLKSGGAFHRIKHSRWRQQRLLILCYHGIATEDENQWLPHLYMTPELLEQRLAKLRTGNYPVLPLGEALEQLSRRDLPPYSVAITFDDGGYDFYSLAWPLLQKYKLPATVYLTTYYSEVQSPTPLIASYMLWKKRQGGPFDLTELGIKQPVFLSTAQDRQAVWSHLSGQLSSPDFNGNQKEEIAARLARCLEIDYARVKKSRILSLMNLEEVKELAAQGVDFQLHTHRHRTPLNEDLFRQEIRDNRASLAKAVAGERAHFCYPSGAYRPEFLKWLAAEQVISATTCDTGLATPEMNPLLLPRLVDTSERTNIEFESWLTGVGHFLSRRRRAPLAYVPE